MAAPVRLSLPLEYQQSIFQELRAGDGLVVLGKGLGLLRVATNLVHSYDAAGNNLVIVVGADERENTWLGESLAEQAAVSGATQARGLTVVKTEFTSVGAREKMYAAGGVFSVTSRILVVDLLTGLLGAETVTGMVVLHAERVHSTSLEAFILRIYRQKNRAGFLKALSDNPDGIAGSGMSPLTGLLRTLFLRKASLWPRFQVQVAQSLEGRRPKQAEVIELEVAMTDSMADIQSAVLECVEVSIQELKRGNSGLDTEGWTVEGALGRNFDAAVRRQLEPNWHRTSWKTRQIVGDLTVLRGLLGAVLTMDAVGLLQHLDTIHAAHAPALGSTRQSQSPWLFLDAAQKIFETARRRVYAAERAEAGKVARGENSSGDRGTDTLKIDTLKPVLEEQPKWAVLAGILDEIERELQMEPPGADGSNGTVLIMCGSTDTCRQLREYLQTMRVKVGGFEKEKDEDEDGGPSGRYMMRRKLRNYLRWKRQFAAVNASLFSENQRALGAAVPDPRLRRAAPANKRRRTRGGSASGTSAAAGLGRADNGSVAQYFEKPDEVAGLLSEVRVDDGKGPSDEEVQFQGSRPAHFDDNPLHAFRDPLDQMDEYYALFDMAELVVVHAYDGDRDEHVLSEIAPRFVVMYEPDPAFIRRVEVYRSSHNNRWLRVYFLYYQGSVEEQRYLSAVRREKDSFTALIKERASMALVMGTGPGGVDDVSEDPQEAFLRTVNTRIAGGGRLGTTTEQPRVVVDVREFRSSLPSLIHAQAMDVVPCMLTVGDYVLSPDIVVERKSLPDLISSFRDGRLYAQAESMLAHYRTALLLIEFDQSRSFTLEPFADYSGASAASSSSAAPDLHAKLALLTLAFPRLRILWSSSPHETAATFSTLKSQEPEPDPLAAVRIGTGSEGGAGQQVWTTEPRDMLAAVPGVTARNLWVLARQAGSVRDVANMGEDELKGLVGREDGALIWEFFNKRVGED